MTVSTYSRAAVIEDRWPVTANGSRCVPAPSEKRVPDPPEETQQFEGEVVALIPALRIFALSLTRNAAEADDLVQESLLKALSHSHQFKLGTNLRAWLFTIQRNTYYTRHARRRKEASCGLEETAGLGCEPGQEWVLKLKTVDRAMQQLPRQQREALMLVGGSGLSYEEAAQTCGCALGTIRSRINRGRARLLQLLGSGPDDDFLYGDRCGY
jgi:RNA polymerase sigma-70 factor, ECF subfamily